MQTHTITHRVCVRVCMCVCEFARVCIRGPQTHIQTRTQTKTRLHDANPGQTKLSCLCVARIYSRYLEFGLEIWCYLEKERSPPESCFTGTAFDMSSSYKHTHKHTTRVRARTRIHTKTLTRSHKNTHKCTSNCVNPNAIFVGDFCVCLCMAGKYSHRHPSCNQFER